jgi:hypothetical protein
LRAVSKRTGRRLVGAEAIPKQKKAAFDEVRVAGLGTQRRRFAALRLRKGEHMDDDKPAEPDPMNLIRRPIHPRIERRRALAASLHIPPELGAKFTEGQLAVLKIISSEVAKRGACTLTMDAIADLSSTSPRTVHETLRTAKAEGLIEVGRPQQHHHRFADMEGVAKPLRRCAPGQAARVSRAGRRDR